MGPPLRLQPPLSHINEDTIKWMKSKLESCVLHNHFNPDKTFIPDRLIDVREDQLSLVLTTDFQPRDAEKHRYIALTYCWGPEPHASKQLKTTSVNIHQHQQQIPELSLPQVIKDAVAVTRALSIPFLWVDALCILQDDTSDWEKQCAVMERIYGNAYAAVAAVSSHTCEEGFLKNRDRIVLPFGTHSDKSHALDIYSPLYQATVTRELLVSPWLSRGWTFQERIASTRILMFSKGNIHFKCKYFNETMGSERHTDQASYIMLDRLTIDSGSTAAIYQEWIKMVAEIHPQYHELTRPTDLLPSIAGIASLFNKRLKDDYAAGIWKNSMHQSLCWDSYIFERHSYHYLLKSLETPSPYIAPSWSWASRREYFSFKLYRPDLSADCRPEFRKLETAVVLRGQSGFGEVRDAALTITSKVYMGSPRLTYDNRPRRFLGQDIVRFEGRYFADIEPDCFVQDIFESTEGHTLAVPISFLLIGSTIRRETDAGDFSSRCPDNCQPLRSFTESAESGGDLEKEIISKRAAYGLLIHPTGNPNEYYRIGTFFSEPEFGGGLSIFDNIEVRTVRLV
ncbi:hypothetical protein FCIRC_11344 [Fusarium circinatum]|uniref:Heterokaryon incompatibility domain-containing protein n=1 Tax=Fusarium circinatum TaxID=48490 RepID=A0A8H5T490_FUSCI|nr:hypothetical protein FCIRC_11344 [Fusarium circinatum]